MFDGRVPTFTPYLGRDSNVRREDGTKMSFSTRTNISYCQWYAGGGCQTKGPRVDACNYPKYEPDEILSISLNVCFGWIPVIRFFLG